MLRSVRAITFSLLFLLVVAGLVTQLTSLSGRQAILPTPESQVLQEATVQEEPVPQTIQFLIDSGAEIKEFQVVYQEGLTPFSILENITQGQDTKLVTQEFDFGVMVEAIGEQVNSPEAAWIYFVNGQAGGVASDQFILQAGDVVEWRFTEPTTEE